MACVTLKVMYTVFLNCISHSCYTVCKIWLFAVITNHLIFSTDRYPGALKHIKPIDTPTVHTLVSLMHVKVLMPLCALVNMYLFIRMESTVTFPTSARDTVITSLIDICLNSHLLAYFCADWRLGFSSPDNFIKAVMVRQSDWQTETKG